MTSPAADFAPDANAADVVRRDEHLRVSTEAVPVERIRVRKVIVTEQRTVTVDVSREEIQIIREPVTDPVEDTSTRVSVTPLVIIRHEEQIEVVKTVVPVERVTIDTRAVTHAEEVSASLAREEVDISDSSQFPIVDPLS